LEFLKKLVRRLNWSGLEKVSSVDLNDDQTNDRLRKYEMRRDEEPELVQATERARISMRIAR